MVLVEVVEGKGDAIETVVGASVLAKGVVDVIVPLKMLIASVCRFGKDPDGPKHGISARASNKIETIISDPCPSH